MVCWLNGFILQYRTFSCAFGPKISIFRSKQQRLYGDGLEKSDLFTSVRQKLLYHSMHQRLWLLEHVTFVSLMNYASMALRFFITMKHGAIKMKNVDSYGLMELGSVDCEIVKTTVTVVSCIFQQIIASYCRETISDFCSFE